MTTITNEFGSVTLANVDLDNATDPAISLSGGVDSAILLYHFFKANQDTDKTFKVITGNDLQRPWHKNAAINVLAEIRSLFDRDVVSEHIHFNFDTSVEDHRSSYTRALAQQCYNGFFDFLITGRTGNPESVTSSLHTEVLPTLTARNIVLDEHISTEIYLDEAGKVTLDTENGTASGEFFKVWSPFVGVDKRWPAEEFKSHNLLENVFPHTISCLGYREETRNFSQPCQNCFWCLEKEWAYGCFDGGEPTIS